MKKLSRFLFNVSVFALMPAIAGAAGTYYNGNMYQNPQNRYGANAGGFYNNYGNSARGYGQSYGYGQNMNNTMGVRKTTTTTTTTTRKKAAKANTAAKSGFQLDVGLSHEFADWDFEMKKSGSKLHYDGLRWNVIDGEAAFYFGGSMSMQVKAGAKYGMQYDEIAMVDDDISSEKMWDSMVLNVGGTNEGAVNGTPALSVGTGTNGTQMGFNAEFGLTDLFKIGNLKVTPSIGYRYLKYKVETKKNYGLTVDVLNSETNFVNCIEVQGGEIQCSPYVGFADANGYVLNSGLGSNGEYIYFSDSFAGFKSVPVYNESSQIVGYKNVIFNNTAAARLDLGETYYYEQSGTSHSYETTWMGPYLALNMEYTINDNNLVNLDVEFGLPMYDSKGNQPYRFDWAHPTSVEDKGDFGDAYHLGLNGNWSTKLSDSIALVLGFTYDYYHVSGATAKTYLNATYWQGELDDFQTLYNNGDLTAAGEEYLEELKDLKASGWKIESKSEIESIYKSMGIRLGLNVQF